MLGTSTIRKYNIPEKGRGLGQMTPRIFGIPLSISPKPVKLESSKLVHGFILPLPTSAKDNISERGPGLGHVTPRIFGIPSTIFQKSVRPDT